MDVYLGKWYQADQGSEPTFWLMSRTRGTQTFNTIRTVARPNQDPSVLPATAVTLFNALGSRI